MEKKPAISPVFTPSRFNSPDIYITNMDLHREQKR